MRIHVAFFSLAFSGCIGDLVKTNTPTPEPPGDNRMGALGLLCEAELTIAGKFELGAPQPAEISGCWPVGTWTFSATVAKNDCTDAPRLEPQYVFTVTRDAEENDSYQYMNNPAYDRVRMKVTSGGSGLCEGGFEVYSPDGKIIVNLKPNLYADRHLDGQGNYEVYDEDQW